MTCFIFMSQHTVHVHIFPATTEQDRKISLVLLPAIGVPIKKYQTFISELNRHGFEVITADYPYCGENLPHIHKGIDYNYTHLVELFMPALLTFATHRDVALVGHSIGAHLATLYASQHPVPVIGIATGNIHYKNWSGIDRVKMLAVATLFKTVSARFGYFPGYKFGFGNKEAKGIMYDWCHTVFTGNYSFFSSDVSIVQSPGIFINIKKDTFSPPKSTMGLAKLYHHNQIFYTELDKNLHGNPHSLWLKQPIGIIEIILQQYPYLFSKT